MVADFRQGQKDKGREETNTNILTVMNKGETPGIQAGLSRRSFLGRALAVGAGLMTLSSADLAQAMIVKAGHNGFFKGSPADISNVSPLAIGQSSSSVAARSLGRGNKRRLSFYHTHTGEDLELTYAVGRIYNPVALEQLNTYLGDFRTGEIHEIDPELMDILWALQQRSGKKGVFSVISGYRSPRTNAYLQGRSRRSGVASRSLHMEGRAIDVRFSEEPTEALRDYAIDLQAGGVGFYPESDFVHLDTGKFRTW